MPGHPKKKATSAKRMYQHYSMDLLKEALDAVFEGKMSERVASKTFGILKPIISDTLGTNRELMIENLGAKLFLVKRLRKRWQRQLQMLHKWLWDCQDINLWQRLGMWQDN